MIALSFVLGGFTLLLTQQAVTEYLRFRASFTLPSWQLRMPPERRDFLSDLWEAKRNRLQ